MKCMIAILLVLSLHTAGVSQQISFEGFIDYQVEIKSKSKLTSDETLKTLSGYGNTLRVYIKKGKYYRVSGIVEEYVGLLPKENIIKYKNRDTLYKIPDTTHHGENIQVKRNDKNTVIANYNCKSIRLISKNETEEYFYTPELVQLATDNPNISGTSFHRFLLETNAIWLKHVSESPEYLITYTATRVQQQIVDDKLLQPPALPETLLEFEHLIEKAAPKSEKDWIAYMQRTVKAELANKHLKIPKGEKSIKQTVIVEFIVTSTGAIGEVWVQNAKEVHPALAKEAIRVIKEGYGWKPATFLGKKIDALARQPVTFMSTY